MAAIQIPTHGGKKITGKTSVAMTKAQLAEFRREFELEMQDTSGWSLPESTEVNQNALQEFNTVLAVTAVRDAIWHGWNGDVSFDCFLAWDNVTKALIRKVCTKWNFHRKEFVHSPHCHQSWVIAPAHSLDRETLPMFDVLAHKLGETQHLLLEKLITLAYVRRGIHMWQPGWEVVVLNVKLV